MSAVLDLRSRPVAAPASSAFARDVVEGLARPRKSIPCTWLYDHLGSALFERITEVAEYYPTRAETMLLEHCAAEIACAAGPGVTVVELGSGSSRKTPLLLQALDRPAGYVPIDISAQFLAESLPPMRARFPALPITPVVADFTQLTQLPRTKAKGGRRLVFFPGSTIGNFTPDAAMALLTRMARAAGPNAMLVVGADATQDPAVLIPAYDDSRGVTAAFNKNLLARINRELDANFSLTAFKHEARWNADEQRVEMHLVSRYTQSVAVLGRPVHFAMGESIHTENAYKHGLLKFRSMAARSGWEQTQLWTGGQSRYAVHVFESASTATMRPM